MSPRSIRVYTSIAIGCILPETYRWVNMYLISSARSRHGCSMRLTAFRYGQGIEATQKKCLRAILSGPRTAASPGRRLWAAERVRCRSPVSRRRARGRTVRGSGR